MKILVADDDNVTLAVVSMTLEVFGYEIVEASDGEEAWKILQQPDAPQLVILDWNMPGLDGTEVCRKVRSLQSGQPCYLIILTSRDNEKDVLEALNAGADEFLTKPVNPWELRARIEVGKRLITLQNSLADHVQRLQEALDQVKTLQGILPICAYCKKIRNDQQYWQQVEDYISNRTNATFSHGVCPDCMEIHVGPELEELKRNQPRD